MKFISTFSITIVRNVNRKYYSTNASLKKRICVVGAGPAGFYTSQYLLKYLPDTYIDIVEKLPVPFGLVRFGVAPDHPEVKNVINTFTKVGENPRVRFLGNLTLGKDFTLNELREKYHAVILSYGAEKDRQLNVENETNNKMIISAREFVAWYNGLPGYENLNPNLNVTDVTLIGQGNVAMDVARILLSTIDQLRHTDITNYALEQLSNSKIERIYMCGRRGPLQAAFTIKELREILKLSNVKTIWRPHDFIGIGDETELKKLARPKRRIIELMLNSLKSSASSSSTETTTTTTNNNSTQKQKLFKEFLPIFFRSPKSISFHNEHEQNPKKALNLLLTINELSGNAAVETNETELLKTDLILRSIGYQSINIDNDILNFDNKNGCVNNSFGRVLKKNLTGCDNTIDDIEDKYENGLYVTGWLATGPTGVIITTMNHSFLVGDNICKDFQMNKINIHTSKSGLDVKRYPNVVTWNDWLKIDKSEILNGAKYGKPREKIIDINKMLEIAKS